MSGRRRFAILDRDGTVIVERHYLSDPDGVVLAENAAVGLRRLSELGLGILLVTNQSAVGRGMFGLDQVSRIHARLESLLEAEGVALDGIYVCPHRPDEGCVCRKPGTALVDRAAVEHGFDPAESFVIGDKASDIELGRRVGAVTILVRTGYGAGVEAEGRSRADHVVDDLAHAARVVEETLSAAAADAAGVTRRERPALPREKENR